MAISPRASEVAAVTAILESDDFEDSKAMARAIVQTVAAELCKRDARGVAAGFEASSPALAFGPYWHKADAAKAVEWARGCGMYAREALLMAPSRAMSRPDAWSGVMMCATCGHHKAIHDPRWGCSIKRNTLRPSPGDCPCDQYKEKDRQ